MKAKQSKAISVIQGQKCTWKSKAKQRAAKQSDFVRSFGARPREPDSFVQFVVILPGSQFAMASQQKRPASPAYHSGIRKKIAVELIELCSQGICNQAKQIKAISRYFAIENKLLLYHGSAMQSVREQRMTSSFCSSDNPG